MKILVAGDSMLDCVMNGNIRISDSWPTYPIVKIDSEEYQLGGASNVANNLTTLGVDVVLSGSIGYDKAGYKFLDLLNATKIKQQNFFQLYEKPTTQKTRIFGKLISDYSTPTLRYDVEDITKIRLNLSKFSKYDAVVISDYNKGFVTEELLNSIDNIPLKIANPKPANAAFYLYFDVVVLNEKELHDSYYTLFGRSSGNFSIEHIAAQIQNQMICKYLLVTAADKGMTLFPQNLYFEATTKPEHVVDVCGCGDVVTSVLAHSLVHGISIEKAVELANFAAGLSVRKFGTSTVSLEELNEYDSL